MKDLNRSQLIMLALLLSFVTSIATGIVTVTLMQQAPDSVVAPINRVIRQTVEKIVQVPGSNTVQTVVVKEEDLVVDAIEKNNNSVMTASREGFNEDGDIIEVSVGRGLVVAEGLVLIDSNYISSTSKVFIENNSGEFETELITTSKDGYTLLRIGEPLGEESQAVFQVPTFGDINSMKRGQKMIMLGDSVNSFMYEGDPDLSLSVSRSSAGSMVLNLDGEVVGVALAGDNSFVPISSVLETINSLDNSPDPEQEIQ